MLALACGPPDGPQIERSRGMVRVPKGAFMRGCQPGEPFAYCKSDPEDFVLLDVPAREIELSEFWIDEFEATRESWRACMDAGVCTEGLLTLVFPDEPGLPAAGVTWEQASEYCAWRGKRLPTEAQWEKAARGTDGRPFPWGLETPACGDVNAMLPNKWVEDPPCEVARRPLPVDMFPKDISPYGAVGMWGNVQEWTADWADQTYYERAPSVDPPGPEESNVIAGPDRIVRGSYYLGGPVYTYRRMWHSPDGDQTRIGVRCASSVPPEELDDPLDGAP